MPSWCWHRPRPPAFSHLPPGGGAGAAPFRYAAGVGDTKPTAGLGGVFRGSLAPPYPGRMDADPEVVALIRRCAVTRRNEPFRLASGASSHFYVDVKQALCRPDILRAVSTAIADLARRENVHFTHVGGLTMGADAVAVGVSLTSGAQWFSVRKAPKERGHGREIEGAPLDSESRVLLVDDVVSTGGSTLKALDAVLKAGATAVAAIPVVDRGGNAVEAFSAVGIRYLPLIGHQALGIPPLGTE